MQENKKALNKYLTKTILILLQIVNARAKNDKSDIFYILKATNKNTRPFNLLENGQESFVNRACAYQNCFITDNKKYLKSVTDFDAVLFNAEDIYKDPGSFFPPKVRSSHQKYIFAAIESAANHPVKEGDFDGYFNWTWTYRLDSDIPFDYIVVRDSKGQVVGPKREMHWMDYDKMKPTSKYTRRKLRKKSIAAAWFVSNCRANNKRLEFAHKLKKELNKYGERVDIYGHCGFLECPKDGLEDSCYAMIERDYFFYLAFENSFSEDYVTEKILIALEHFAVPIVYGGANYTRFMPEGAYINARSFVPEKLAVEILQIMNNKARYYDFFKWHRYYSYSHSRVTSETNRICALCAALNNETLRTETSVYTNLSLWWNESQPINLPEPEVSKKPMQVEIVTDLDHENNTMTSVKPTTKNSIKEFISNVLEYYETI